MRVTSMGSASERIDLVLVTSSSDMHLPEAKALTRIGNHRTDSIEPTERTTEVWAAVRRLPQRQAQVIALFYWDDRSQQQIASVLDCSSETAKTHLKRARAALADDLHGMGVSL